MQKMMELKQKICPRPWTIVGPDKNGVYKMNYGRDDTVASRDLTTLEFLQYAADFVDSLEMKKTT
jgi:hypothetical protein